MKGRNRWLLGALFVVALLMGMPRAASSRTLDDIIKSGQILIGIDLNSPPYGFQDPDGQPTGSEVETAQLLAKDFGVKLQIVPTTVANRVPYLVTDRVRPYHGYLRDYSRARQISLVLEPIRCDRHGGAVSKIRSNARLCRFERQEDRDDTRIGGRTRP